MTRNQPRPGSPPGAAGDPGWRPAIWTHRLHYVPATAVVAAWTPSCGGGPVARGLCGFPGYLDDEARGGRWWAFRRCRECADALAPPPRRVPHHRTDQQEGTADMSLDKTPTIRSRELGEELRAGLRAAELTAQRVAEIVGWNPSTFTRLMLGERKAKESDLATVLAVLGIQGERRERLLQLGRDYYTRTWLQEFEQYPPVSLRTLVEHEAVADSITLWAPRLVPELLRTPDYARAVLDASPTLPPGEADERVTALTARQRTLHHDPFPSVTVLLGEAALTTEVGSPAVLAAQLAHLRQLAGRPYITLRVVPAGHGPQATVSCAFTRLRGERFSPVICLETEVAALFLEKSRHVAAYDRVIAALQRAALDERSSRELLAERARAPEPVGAAAD